MQSNFRDNILKKFADEVSPSVTMTDSFNLFVTKQIGSLLLSQKPIECVYYTHDGHEKRLSIQIITHKLLKPLVIEADFTSRPVTPYECRIRKLTYSGPLYVNLEVIIDDRKQILQDVYIGRIPVMIYSSLCHIKKEDRVKFKECDIDAGGYFIISGSEKILVSQVGGLVDRMMLYKSRKSCSVAVKSKHMQREYTTTIEYVSGKSPMCITFPRLNGKTPVMYILIAMGLSEEKIKNCFTQDQLSLMYGSMENLPQSQEEARRLISIMEIYNLGESEDARLDRAFESMLVPHIPLNETGEKYNNKYCFLIKMIQELLKVVKGKKPTDRDSLINQRMHSSFTLLSTLFLQLLITWSENLRKDFNKILMDTKVKKVTIKKITHVISNNTTITDGMTYALATGTFNTKSVNKKVLKGVAQQAIRHSYHALLSQLRKLSSNIDAERNKDPKPRFIDGSHYGRICPAESPEGKNVGIEKTLAISCYISLETSAHAIKKICKNFLLPMKLENMNVGSDVYVNGEYVGNTSEGEKLVSVLRKARRGGQLEKDVSISILDNVVHVSSTSGRLCRPLLIVHKGKLVYRDDEQMTWKECLIRGYIEYLDSEEEQTCLVAFNPEDITPEHTHCEIKNSLMNGMNAASIPFSDRNPAPRNCFQSAMGKQAQGVYATNYQHRFDTTANVLYYQQKPLVETELSKLYKLHECAHGLNAVVAIMPFNGFGQEDSIIINKAFIERGGFRADHYTTVEEQAVSNTKEKSIFGVPKNKRKVGEYKKLDVDGIVMPGTKIQKKDCIVGKSFQRSQYKQGKTVFEEDQSVLTDKNGYIENVKLYQDRRGGRGAKIKIRTRQIPVIGDKFSSRHGQKGTIGMIYPTEDLPFSMVTGIAPDIIVNPAALPSRMTIAHMLETLTGKAVALSGKAISGAPYTGLKVDDVAAIVKQYGFQKHGNEAMISGTTGEMLQSQVFMGPIFYQRLKHMVEYKYFARRRGKKDALTLQPVQGRSRGGALRIGEMEKDTLGSHAAPHLIRDRMLLNSDLHKIFVCPKCKQPQLKEGCQTCNSSTREIEIPYASALLFQELKSMCINTKLHVD